ncbi:hypothetical protein E2562_028317 [Oryza meyeriana var. granulata]|uniref:Uncharacterized protein n=1 Tax=Oryza meyeriana var. granulata TaxID=110450 RepID=A0A6G1FCY6_9ORYZ|nr:hypothetical protein E2562_028317 [Oryza meyeriana var. granulata]
MADKDARRGELISRPTATATGERGAVGRLRRGWGLAACGRATALWPAGWSERRRAARQGDASAGAGQGGRWLGRSAGQGACGSSARDRRRRDEGIEEWTTC